MVGSFAKRIIFFFLGVFLFLFLAQAAVPSEGVIDNLRDLVYKQELDSGEILPFYEQALDEIYTLHGDSALGFALSARIEYFMGRVFQYEGDNDSAIIHYEKGFVLTEKSLELETTVLALLMQSECISQMCAIKPVPYAMANGLKVGSLADDVLKLDPENTAALYLKAARYIYAPKLFADQKKGRKMLLKGLEEFSDFPPDDEFNFYLALGYSYIQTKDKEEALLYLNKALEVYPTNEYCRSLMVEAEKIR